MSSRAPPSVDREQDLDRASQVGIHRPLRVRLLAALRPERRRANLVRSQLFGLVDVSGDAIKQIERKRQGYKVELSSGLEAHFNAKLQLVRYDD